MRVDLRPDFQSAGDLSLFGPLSDWGNCESWGSPILAEGIRPSQIYCPDLAHFDSQSQASYETGDWT